MQGFSFSQFIARDYNLKFVCTLYYNGFGKIKLMHMTPLRVDVCDRME